MRLASLPSTRLSATALPEGCTNCTVLPAPIEKLCQSAIMRWLVWLTTMPVPLTFTPPEPCVMLPPLGRPWAIAETQAQASGVSRKTLVLMDLSLPGIRTAC